MKIKDESTIMLETILERNNYASTLSAVKLTLDADNCLNIYGGQYKESKMTHSQYLDQVIIEIQKYRDYLNGKIIKQEVEVKPKKSWKFWSK